MPPLDLPDIVSIMLGQSSGLELQQPPAMGAAGDGRGRVHRTRLRHFPWSSGFQSQEKIVIY